MRGEEMKDMGLDLPSWDDVLVAHERIAPYIHRTPVLTSRFMNELTGAELFFKCENFQKAGAFKVRGATNAVFGLSDEMAAKGRRDPFSRATTRCRSATRQAGAASPATS
jgi:threonine dehydratase